MKFVVLAVLCLVAVAQARSARRHRRDMNSMVQELKQKFPMDEWKAFYGKLSDALGDQKGEFEKKLEANKGDMSLTLDQWKDKLSTNYPVIKTQWDAQQARFTAFQDKLKTITLNDIASWGKDKLTKYTQNLNYGSVQDWWKDAQIYAMTWFNQIQAQAQG